MKATRSLHIGMKKNIVLDAAIAIPRWEKVLFVNVQRKTNEKLCLCRDTLQCVSTYTFRNFKLVAQPSRLRK